ncbi:MAG: type I-MYXAN CRISPR-associated protein Cmx8 [Cryomorphaceae bacterium]|nr:type I-MYXAN CRISPR-associated protein Cmx8 [Cryomorphaceae bacterium]
MRSGTMTKEKSLKITYSLAELPSSQHRAGLVGLILLAKDIENSSTGRIKILDLDDDGVEIEFDEKGLEDLLNEVYAATEELEERTKKIPKAKLVKTETRIEIDPKTKKEKKTTVYFYNNIVPRGEYLDRFDRSPDKIWMKLWRNMLWQIMRGVPATRKPFEERAKGNGSKDVGVIWDQLSKKLDTSVKLPSTYFLGAQETNAEGVPFKDLARFQFLLHFWPFVAQVYIPVRVDKDGKRAFDGYCIAIPDVAALETFCSDYPRILEDRSNEPSGYRPKDSLIDIPEEAGLDIFRRLTESVRAAEGRLETSDLVFGVDIYHARKDGNNVRILYCNRIEPLSSRDREYEKIRSQLKDHLFRHQRLMNLVKGNDWYEGFDRLLCTIPPAHAFFSPFFSRDARVCFEIQVNRGEKEMRTTETESEALAVFEEAIILKIIDEYLREKLRDKYNLTWKKIEEIKSNEKLYSLRKKEYGDRKDALVKEAFYAIRSRTGEDFINYFASTICSVPHWLSEGDYMKLTKALYQDTDRIRTLSMLALSTKGTRAEYKEKKDNE